jgi:muramoyltetrapeptide carboxypeptidase
MNSDGHISDTPENRAKDFMEMFQDPEVDIVMSIIGGNHSNQILKYIDWEVIKRNPKSFVGFSDISVLHFALYTQTKSPTYYGPAFITQF